MLERIKLVALNTGLEGARLGESTGKALVAVAEEVRTLSSRSLDVLATHLRLMDEAGSEQQKLVQTAELVQHHAMDLAGLLRQTQESQSDTLAALDALEKNIERASGLDANVATELQHVATHGEGLLSALERLSATRRHKVVRNLLLPSLEPLLRSLLGDAQLDSPREPKP
jgi:methyl-accepting chemotaxis protein